MQIDLYWHAHDTSDPPHALVHAREGTVVMWHVKDLHKVSRDYTELGNGTIDYTRIWPDAGLSGMRHFFVEQGGNFAVNAMQSAADGMAYVKIFAAVVTVAGPCTHLDSIATARLERAEGCRSASTLGDT